MSLQIDQHLVEPGLTFAVGGFRRRVGQRIDAAIPILCDRSSDLLAQGGILDHGKAEAEAGQVEGFARREQRHAAVGDFRRERGNRDMLTALVDQVAVNFVGAEDQVVAQAELGDAFQFRARVDAPDRIMRVAEDEQSRLWRDGGFERVEVDFVAQDAVVHRRRQRRGLQQPIGVVGARSGTADRRASAPARPIPARR